MKRLAFPLLFLALSMTAFAQTSTTYAIKTPAGCTSISNCITHADDATNSLVWTAGVSYLEYNPSPSTGLGLYATNVSVYDLVIAPGTDKSQQYPFTLRTVGSDTADTFTLDLSLAGFKFYYPGGGGRGCGGCGWKYTITSGTITVTQ